METETKKITTPAPTKPDNPAAGCTCHTVVGVEDIEVYTGARGHVVLKQYDDSEGGYCYVFVLPNTVPRLIELLRKAAKHVDTSCPAAAHEAA